MSRPDILALLGVGGAGTSTEGTCRNPHAQEPTRNQDSPDSCTEEDQIPTCDDLEGLKQWLITKTAAFYETPRVERLHRIFTDQYVAEDCVHDTYYGGIATREEQFDIIQQMRDLRPDWYNIVQHVEPHVPVQEGKVSFVQMYVYISIVGYREGVDLPHLGVLNWKLRDGRWWIVRHEALRGPPTKGTGMSGWDWVVGDEGDVHSKADDTEDSGAQKEVV